MNPLKLGLSPKILEDENDVALVQDAFDRVEPNEVLFNIIADTAEPVQAFVAHTPDDALKWICQRVSKRHLMQVVNQVYENPDVEASDGADGDSQNGLSDESGRPTKRAKPCKEPTTRQVNRRLKERFDIALLETVASTQDLETVKRNDLTYSPAEQRYRNFAKQLHGVGVKEVAEMMNRANAVASFECLQDWCVVLETWREMHRDGKRLFANTTAKLPVLGDNQEIPSSVGTQSDLGDQEGRMVLSQSTEPSAGPAGFTGVEVDGFCHLLAIVKRSETADILGDMRHRWVMAALYTEYERLEGLLRRRVKLTSSRGRGIATVARQQLFGEVYRRETGMLMTEDDDPARYRAWNRYLDYGKRWSMLKERFGVGIFALLPRGGVPNSFVERRPIQRLAEWIDMVASCNAKVKDMAVAIEPLLADCMREGKPPEQLLFEVIDAEDVKDWDPVDLLSPSTDTQRDFETVADNI